MRPPGKLWSSLTVYCLPILRVSVRWFAGEVAAFDTLTRMEPVVAQQQDVSEKRNVRTASLAVLALVSLLLFLWLGNDVHTRRTQDMDNLVRNTVHAWASCAHRVDASRYATGINPYRHWASGRNRDRLSPTEMETCRDAARH